MSKPLILMYHRIADEPIDPWGLAVSPAHFEEQLDVLRRTRRPLPLAEFMGMLDAGSLPPDAATLTFDDGYADNLTAGLPRLAAAEVPATVFLATGFIDRCEPFWWDELARFILHENAPKSFEVEIQGRLITFELDSESSAGEGAHMPDGPKDRRSALEALYEPLRHLDDEGRRAIMIKLRSIFSAHNDCISLGRAMTSQEVRMLATSGLVKIGAHTVTHPSLPRLEASACHREVAQSKIACEAIVAAPVAAFAYPYGEFNTKVREAVKNAGFAMACTSRRGPAFATSDVLAMPRIYVPNYDGDAFEQRIRWASALSEEYDI
jgi:peptidoglycan/xylan/chitin deacetylase (PgdA/CDA1 family)